jgi:HEPN domain-containing protein
MKRSEVADKWWRQAKHDLDVADSLAAQGHWDACALMCQQAAELAVKALWIDAKQVEMPPKTHWVASMAVELGAPEEVIVAVNRLVGDYISSRYPDTGLGIPDETYTAEHASDRIEKARLVLVWIEQKWEQIGESN